MWIVAKIKNKEISFFINQIEKKIGSNVKFYCPKIELERWFGNKVVKYEKSLLEDYIFCYHDSFKNEKSLSSLNFIKGLKFFLKGCELNQKEIVKIILKTINIFVIQIKYFYIRKIINGKLQMDIVLLNL